jgi:hypothetical protein
MAGQVRNRTVRTGQLTADHVASEANSYIKGLLLYIDL